MRYAVVIEKTGTGYSAFVPDLPGCIATAKSKVGVKAELRSAIRLHICGLREDGLPIPEPTSFVGYVEQ